MLMIVHGEDVVSAEREVQRLRAETDPDGLSTTLLDDSRLTVDDISRAAEALPFFGGQRFVAVRGFLQRLCKPAERGKEATSQRETAIAQLAALWTRLPPTTTLVFWEPVRLKLPAALEQAAAAGTISLHAAPARPAEQQPWLEQWLADEARLQDIRLTKDAGRQLVSQTMANLRSTETAEREQQFGIELLRLVSELEKMATYAGAGGTVDAHVVAALATDPRAQVFDLVDAVAVGATPRALRLLEQTLAEGLEPLALLRLLDRQLSALLKAEAAGGTLNAIETRLKAPGWLARKYNQQLRGLHGAALQRAHAQLAEADLNIKTGRASGEAAVRDVVLRLCLDRRGAA